MRSKFFLFAGLIVVAVGVTFTQGDTSKEAMQAKYGGDPLLRTAAGIHYRDQGNPNGPVLLLLHGSNASLHTWEPLVERLKDSFRLISFDQYGHGLSGAPSTWPYTVTTQINTAIDVMDTVGVDTAVWVGNSMGGRVAWQAALLNPERISGLVLLNAGGAQADEVRKPYLAAKLAGTKLGQFLLPHVTPRWVVKKSLTQTVLDPSFATDKMVDRYWELIRYPGNRKTMAHYMAHSVATPLWQNINAIDVPTLILWGQHDGVVPVSHADAFERQIANTQKRIYSNAGHLPMEEVPDQVAADIVQWAQQQALLN